MSVLRRRVQESYTVVPNSVLEDVRLSWAARGMLAYLLSKPDGWQVREAHLVRASEGPRTGADAVKSHLGELERAGYLRRGWEVAPNGLRTRVTEVTDVPNPEWANTTKEPENMGLPAAGKTVVGQTGAGQSHAVVNTELEITELSTSPPAKPAGRKPRPRDPLFDAFVEAWGYNPAKPAPRICGLAGDFSARVKRRCGAVEGGLLLWREWVSLQKASRNRDGTPVWGNVTTTHNATTRFLGWVDSRTPTQQSLEPWYFIDTSGRKLLRSPALAIAELGLSADPYRPDTWPPEMHAAYAERLVVMDGNEVFM